MRKSSESEKNSSPNPRARKSTKSSPQTAPESSNNSLGRCPKADELPRASAALVRLKISEKELASVPRISDWLKSAYAKIGSNGRKYPGSAHRAVDDLRFSPDPVAQRFIETYDKIPSEDLRSLPLEAICLKAGVSATEFIGMVFLARQSLGKAESSFVAVNAFPDVVRDMVRSSRLASGHQDRKMLAQHTAIGFLPAPKGASIAVNLFGGEAKFSGGEEDQDDGDDDEIAGFNDAFSGGIKEVEEWSDARRKLLESGKK